MPWTSIDSSFGNDVIQKCVDCFQNAASGAHSSLDVMGVRDLLGRRYREVGGSTRDLFRLSAWPSAVPAEIEIVVSFYKTINRFPPQIPTMSGFSIPTRRHWCIAVGFKTGKSAAEIYLHVRDRCKAFFRHERDIIPFSGGVRSSLCIYEDAGTTNHGTTIDQVFDEFERDAPPGGKVVRLGPRHESAFAAFAIHCPQLRSWEIVNILD